jgi:hypothetical protein
VDELGWDGAQGRFGELMTRCRAPRIADAAIDTKKFEFTLTGGHAGWWWGWSGAPGSKPAIYHANVGRLDIYENHKVFVLDPDGRRMTEFLFGGQEDCFLFADLVWSFRSYQGAPGGTGGTGSSGGTGSTGGTGGTSGGEERRSSNVLEGDQKGTSSEGTKSGDESSGGDESGDGAQKSKNVLGDD